MRYWTIYSMKDFPSEDTIIFFDTVQVSAADLSNGLTSVLYVRIFVFMENGCDLSWLFSPKYDLLEARCCVIYSETLVLPVTKYQGR